MDNKYRASSWDTVKGAWAAFAWVWMSMLAVVVSLVVPKEFELAFWISAMVLMIAYYVIGAIRKTK